jgi:hypothetical protein
MIRLDPLAAEKINTGIFISGPGRTGTTMFGNIVHSMQHVEYSYEPSMMFSHIPMIERLVQDDWMLLFETYMFEDFLVNAIAGRRLNLNAHDDASVYKAKPESEIRERLGYSHRRSLDLDAIREAVLVFKMVDAVPYLRRIRDYYPGLRMVVLFRRVESIISSLMQKRWLADDGLSGFSAMWPYHECGDLAVPFWVLPEDIERFAAMGELERCCYYFIRMYGALPDDPSLLVVDYDTFKQQPRAQFENIAAELGLRKGAMTDSLLEGVREPTRNRDIDFSSLPAGMRSEIDRLSEAVKVRAVQA